MNVALDIPPDEVDSVRAAILACDVGLDVRAAGPGIPAGWADCLLTWAPDASRFALLSPHGFVQAYGAGVDRILAHPDLPEAAPVTRIVDPRMSLGMTQHVVLAVLRWFRADPAYRDQQARHLWARLPHPDAAEWPIGIFGMGAMGTQLCEALRQLGFPVQGWRRRDDASGDFGAFLSRCRVLVCLAPLTVQTRGRLDLAALRLMPRGGYVINCSRGGVFVRRDLLVALDEGHLAGAALDVFEQEPLREDDPIWDRRDIIVTPHIATFPTAAVTATQVAENLKRHRAGQPLANEVDRTQGY